MFCEVITDLGVNGQLQTRDETRDERDERDEGAEFNSYLAL